MNIGKKLKDRRKELDLTMLQVAKKTGVSEATISRWESGDIANMRRDKIVSLAKALQVSPSFIMDADVSHEVSHLPTEAVIQLFDEESLKKLSKVLTKQLPHTFKPNFNLVLQHMLKNNPEAFEVSDSAIHLYNQLDIEDKAEIRGEMKHMLKADKYNKSNTYQSPPREIAAFGADGTKGTRKRPKREIT